MALDTTVHCPSCGHPINQHLVPITSHGVVLLEGCGDGCGCNNTPNDVAYALLFGGLTPPPPELAEPLSDPTVPDTGRIRPPNPNYRR